MDLLERLDWAEGLAFASSGVRVGFRVTEPWLWLRLVDRLPPDAAPITSPVDHLFSVVSEGALPDANGRRCHVLYDGPHQVLRTDDVGALGEGIESAVRMRVAMSSTTRVFVHAGVVGWHERGIVMPGASRFGKSELVAALVRAGATYYSDEYAVLDERGCVHPYARPLALRNADGVSKRRIPVNGLGGTAGKDALMVGSIFVTRFEAGGSWRPQPLSSGEAVLALLANTVRARLDPPVTLNRLSHVARRAAAFEGPRGEADAAAAAILRALARVEERNSPPAP